MRQVYVSGGKVSENETPVCVSTVASMSDKRPHCKGQRGHDVSDRTSIEWTQAACSLCNNSVTTMSGE